MATLIAEPASTNPETADWQALILKSTKASGGAIETCRLTNWDSTTEPLVAVGSRFEINGSFYEVAPSNEAITGWSGISDGAFAYVYATPSGSSAAFSYSSTAPTWDSAKGGWYNGTARALFRVKRTNSTTWTDKCLMSNGKSREFVDEVNARIAAVSAEAVARAADVDAEEAARIAAVSAEAVARNNADGAEAATRGSADTTLQNNINALSTTINRTFTIGTIAANSTQTIPSGRYYFNVSPIGGAVYFEICDSGGNWRSFSYLSGVLISDGTNARFRHSGTGGQYGNYSLLKIS